MEKKYSKKQKQHYKAVVRKYEKIKVYRAKIKSALKVNSDEAEANKKRKERQRLLRGY